MTTNRYSEAGVDIDAGEALVEAIKPLAKSTRRPGSEAGLGGFGALFDLKAAGFKDPILVATTDGVGTKLKIAIESGLHDTVGIDLVAMCVNDLVVQGAEPLLFLDYYATGKLDVAAGTAIVKGIAEGCRQAGCALVGGETAEMPGMYSSGDYDLAGFSIGAMERGNGIDGSTVKAGDAVIGLASTGVHSNGFSLVRRVVASAELAWDAPAPFATRYAGACTTRPDARLCEVLHQAGSRGSRQGACPYHRRRAGRQRAARHSRCAAGSDRRESVESAAGLRLARPCGQGFGPAEMVRVFNCGVGMVMVVDPAHKDAALKLAREHGETAFEIGVVADKPSADAPGCVVSNLDSWKL